MATYVQKYIPTCLTFFLGFFLFSCQNDDVLTGKSDPLVEDVSVQDDYLVFSDKSEFNETLKRVSTLSENEFKSWEASMRFDSKRTQLNQAIEAISEAKTADELQEAETIYSDIIDFTKGDNFLGTKFPLWQTSALINKEGIVKIGSSILVFKNDRVITIKDGDLSKLAQAEKLEAPFEGENVWVSRIKRMQIGNDNLRTTEVSDPFCYRQYNTGLPRYYRSEVLYYVYENGPGPVAGTESESYEINYRGIAVRIVNGQFGLNTDLSANVSYARFRYSSPSANIADVSRTTSGSNSVTNQYQVIVPLFTGSLFVPQGSDYPVDATLTISHTLNTAIDGQVCNGSNQNVDWNY